MKLFDPDLNRTTSRHRRIHALYEITFTVVDFSAALLFIIGSMLFFNENTTYLATWLFLLGSICFALKPTIRLIREFHLLKLGKVDILADRVEK